MKIDNTKSREIYEAVTRPDNKFTNSEIAKQFGITEGNVRYHVKKWENQIHTIAKTNEYAAQAVANNAIVASELNIDCKKEVDQLIKNVKDSIKDARDFGVSPEKLAPLYSNWLRALDTAAELLGELNRTSQVNVAVENRIIQAPELRRIMKEMQYPEQDA